MKQLNFRKMENYVGGVRCAFDGNNTNPVCVGLFTAFTAAAAGFNNFIGAHQICDAAGVVGCTLEF